MEQAEQVNLGNGLPPQLVAEHMLAQPGVRRVPYSELMLFHHPALVPPEMCAALVQRIDGKRRPSTVADPNGDPTFRTSETCDMPATDQLVRAVECLIGGWCGLDPAYGETLQGQRYAVGQEFKAHNDYFNPLGQDYEAHCRNSGNRTWTVMVYLNKPQAGGATLFTAINRAFDPEPGTALAWCNLHADGTPNPATKHHGTKVVEGTKYVLTKWYRQRPWP